MIMTDLQSKNTIINLTSGKPGQPRIYTEEEMKEQRRERVRKYYRENKEKCNLNNKMYKLRVKGIVEWQGIVLTPKQRGNKKVYTDEEIRQHKRDYYKNKYYMTHREACIERMRKAGLLKKATQAK